MSKSIPELQKFYSDALSAFDLSIDPQNLYKPIEYLLGIGGKRIRPVLVLAGYNLANDDVEKVIPIAHAIEFFHNFSLMHDDIMDVADLRRGKPTVHKKFDINAAILSGDMMLIYSYKFLESYSDIIQVSLLKLFNDTFGKICEGQQLDIDFETRNDVTISEYLEMITNKTAVLLGCALKSGALISGLNDDDQNHLYEFGKNIGIAFQIQDDILDVFAPSENSGKLQGGDILQKKKTYLYLKSLELLSAEKASRLRSLFEEDIEVSDEDLIAEGTQLLKDAHVNVYAQELKESYQQLAMSHLDAVTVDQSRKTELRTFAQSLLNRGK